MIYPCSRWMTILTAVLSIFLLLPVPQAEAATFVPKVHRAGDEGYFSVSIPLPKDAPAGVLSVLAKPRSGDVFMVHASLPQLPEGKGVSTDLVLTGRYGRAGVAVIAIIAKPAFDSLSGFKPLITVSLNLPDTAPPDREVMKTWANYQRRRFTAAAYGGGDSFLGYWNAVAVSRYGLDRADGWANRSGNRTQNDPDLYDIFTGAAAIQESLQFEVLGTRPGRARIAALKAAAGTPVSALPAPAVKSHPFEEMLKGKSPKLPALSSLIPEDQYAVFFKDINKQIALSDLMEDWGGSLLEAVHASSRDFRVRKKIVQQLCLETSLLTRLFGDRVIGEMAFTGNDPFLKEGSDFTVLFSLKNRVLFLEQIEKRYAEAVALHHARREEFHSGGVKHVAVTTPDLRVSSYLVILGDNAVVSNNRETVRKIVQASAGKLPTLSQSPDLKYMRTIFPEGDENEDIFIYLSDRHIRNLVGPVVKIGEARRVRCATNLQILANARFWYKAERRREPGLQDLADEGYLAGAELRCPDHGTYWLEVRVRRAGLLCPQPHRVSCSARVPSRRERHGRGDSAVRGIRRELQPLLEQVLRPDRDPGQTGREHQDTDVHSSADRKFLVRRPGLVLRQGSRRHRRVLRPAEDDPVPAGENVPRMAGQGGSYQEIYGPPEDRHELDR